MNFISEWITFPNFLALAKCLSLIVAASMLIIATVKVAAFTALYTVKTFITTLSSVGFILTRYLSNEESQIKAARDYIVSEFSRNILSRSEKIAEEAISKAKKKHAINEVA